MGRNFDYRVPPRPGASPSSVMVSEDKYLRGLPFVNDGRAVEEHVLQIFLRKSLGMTQLVVLQPEPMEIDHVLSVAV